MTTRTKTTARTALTTLTAHTMMIGVTDGGQALAAALYPTWGPIEAQHHNAYGAARHIALSVCVAAGGRRITWDSPHLEIFLKAAHFLGLSKAWRAEARKQVHVMTTLGGRYIHKADVQLTTQWAWTLYKAATDRVLSPAVRNLSNSKRMR